MQLRYTFKVAAVAMTYALLCVGQAQSQTPPNVPIITEPVADGQIVHPADMHMETLPFSDPDASDTHLCSDWEIWTVDPEERVGVTSCIGGLEKVHTHLGDGIFENSHAGRQVLLFETDYRLRVRHRDSSGDPATDPASLGPAGRHLTASASASLFSRPTMHW